MYATYLVFSFRFSGISLCPYLYNALVEVHEIKIIYFDDWRSYYCINASNCNTFKRIHRNLYGITRVRLFLTLIFYHSWLFAECIFFYRDYKYHLLQDAFQHYYVPFYTNAGNYYLAMLIGLHYDKLKNPSVVKWLKAPILFIFYFIFPLGMIPFFSSYIFYNYEIDEASWWIGVWTTISKHFWGILAFSIVFVFTNKLDS